MDRPTLAGGATRGARATGSPHGHGIHGEYVAFQRSCSEYAEAAQWSEPARGARLYRDAERAFECAESLAPDDGRIVFAHGHAAYVNRDVSVERALHLFDEALARAPDHAWARLYRAHCLYDLERWTEAADAYAAVPKGAFDGPRSWRMHLLVEQRALCLLRGGRREEALALFSKILGRYEAQPHLARWGDLRYADQAVDDLPELKEPLARAREALARTELGR